jgi:hypothetical protein
MILIPRLRYSIMFLAYVSIKPVLIAVYSPTDVPSGRDPRSERT